MHVEVHRRRAYGLAALSLISGGVVLGMPGEAPGTAKEPRPASHFRLVLQSTQLTPQITIASNIQINGERESSLLTADMQLLLGEQRQPTPQTAP